MGRSSKQEFIEWLELEPRILVYITDDGRYYFKKYRLKLHEYWV
jgi:hypothetical protein